MKIDDIDLNILRILQQNGRITNVQLSQEIGLSPAPTLERVKKLEANGFIESYHALINAEKLGLGIMVFIEISIHVHDDKELEDFMREMEEMPEIAECYHITGEYDFLIKTYARDIAEYQKFILQRIVRGRYVKKVHSKVVLGSVKKSVILPLPELNGNSR